jgi:hypothetical protein
LEFSDKKREKLTEEGKAMPHGGYPIRNRADLHRAIQAFGRAKNKLKTKAWIIKRARELNAVDMLPEGWVKEKAAAHGGTMTGDLVLEHYGIKGMKWGVRRSRSELSEGRAGLGRAKAKDLSDDDLKKAVSRMNMEQQYNKMRSRNPGAALMLAGAGFVGTIALGVVRSQITNQANQRVASALRQRASREAAVSRLARLG